MGRWVFTAASSGTSFTLFSTLAACHTEKVDMARMRQSSDAVAEPDVGEPKPDVGRGAEDAHAAGYQPGLVGRLDTRILVDRTLMP
jgi:hypothetical protein